MGPRPPRETWDKNDPQMGTFLVLVLGLFGKMAPFLGPFSPVAPFLGPFLAPLWGAFPTPTFSKNPKKNWGHWGKKTLKTCSLGLLGGALIPWGLLGWISGCWGLLGYILICRGFLG